MSDARKFFGFGLIGAGALAMSAIASGQTQFGDLDANSDDRITLDEWHGGVADLGIFPSRDTNRDNRIDENEFDAMGFDDDFESWDTNNDSYLDDDEYYEGSFDYFDEDESGHWDGDEWDDAGDEGFWDV